MSTIFGTTITRDALLDFARQIDLPEEVIARLSALCGERDLSLYADFVTALRSPDTAPDSVQALDQALEGVEGWPVVLCAHLTAALLNKPALYGAPGIPEAVFVDTMKCFSRFVREHRVSYGEYGFDRGFWTWRQIGGLEYRLGALEFERVALKDTGMARIAPSPAQPGDLVLSVHIPSDADLSRASLDDAYGQARGFFPRYFEAESYAFTGCSSWMLSPRLQTLLGPDSGILRFQSDYDVPFVDADSDECMGWVFKRRYEDLMDLPEGTSLQRNIKELMLTGGHVGAGAGMLRQ